MFKRILGAVAVLLVSGTMVVYANNLLIRSYGVNRNAQAVVNYLSEDQLEIFAMSRSELADFHLPEKHKDIIALAKAGIKELDEKPLVDMEFDCEFMETTSLANWNIYKCSNLADYYYVNFNYTGAIPESGVSDVENVSKWFGPYYGKNGEIYSFF